MDKRTYDVVQFYPWFKFYLPLSLVVMHDNEFQTEGSKIWNKDKTEPQQINIIM